MANKRVKIAIVETSDIIRIGIEHIVDSKPQLSIVHSDKEFIEVLREEVDILIINIDKLAAKGRGVVAELYPNADIIGIIYGYSSPDQRAVCDGVIDIYDSPSKVAQTLCQGVDIKEEDTLTPKVEAGELSEREMEVVAAVARGLISKEIADTLNISIHTVMAHRKNISRKTGIRSISGLVVYALLNGLIEQSEVLK
ncbi:MAG: LuxR C-terminal-related transcriptional regulator [Rikenellaceae bacterium]